MAGNIDEYMRLLKKRNNLIEKDLYENSCRPETLESIRAAEKEISTFVDSNPDMIVTYLGFGIPKPYERIVKEKPKAEEKPVPQALPDYVYKKTEVSKPKSIVDEIIEKAGIEEKVQ